MKRGTALFAVLMLPVFLFAAITGTGIGKTEKEAYNDALLTLGKQVSVSFTGIDFETTSVSNNELTESEYTTRNLASSSVEFFGLESSTKKTADGYEVTLTIPDSAAGLYKTRLDELEVDINSLKKVVDSGNDEIKLKNLPSLYKLVTNYEAYRSIVVKLDSSFVPKALSTGSSAGIKAQYSALYSSQSQKDNLTLQQYNYEVDLGIITADSEKIYQDSLKEIEQRQKEYLEMQRLISDSFEQKAAELELQVSSMRDSLQSAASDVKGLEGAVTISGVINSVEAYKNSFADFKKELDSKLGVFQREYNSQKQTVVRRALTEAVTDSDWENGKLKSGSKSQLENAVRKEVGTILAEYQNSAATLYGDGFDILKLIVQNADVTSKDISSKKLTVSSLSDPSLNVFVDINSFANNQWQAKAVLNVLGYDIEVPFNITYYAWTGSAASTNTIDERISFNKIKSSWESLFADYANEAMEIVLTLSVKTDVRSEGYDLTVSEYKVINTSNGKTVASGKCNIKKSINVKNSADIMDFSLENDLLLVTAPALKTGDTDYARYYRILTGKEKSSLGNIVTPDYKGLNSTNNMSLNLFWNNTFELYFGNRNNGSSYSWNRYDDVLITFDTTKLEYTGSTKRTVEKTTNTTKIGNLYYWFDDNETFNLYDSPHTWQTLRFEHYNVFSFKLKENVEYGPTILTAVMLKDGEKVYEGDYTINVQKPNLEVSRTYAGVYSNNNRYVSTNSVDTLTGHISPTQTMKIRYEISSTGLNSYGGKAINGLTVKYDESKYSVTVTQGDKQIKADTVSRDGNIATATFAVSSSPYVDIEAVMKSGTPAGKDTMQFWYTLDGSRASVVITANIEASTTAWN